MNNQISKKFKVFNGTKQGSIFNENSCIPVYINKRKLNVLMYADDLVVLSETP